MRILTTVIGYLALAILTATGTANAAVNVQCPGDNDGDAVIDDPDPNHPNAKCVHLIAGDSFALMSDGNPMYTFGFATAKDADGNPSRPDDAILNGILDAEWPGTTIELDQRDVSCRSPGTDPGHPPRWAIRPRGWELRDAGSKNKGPSGRGYPSLGSLSTLVIACKITS